MTHVSRILLQTGFEKVAEVFTPPFALLQSRSRTGKHMNADMLGGAGPVKTHAFALGIRKRTLIGWYSLRGGSPFAISIAVMPRLQMSARASYPACLITSGAIQNGVPTKVCRCDLCDESWAATPKSAKGESVLLRRV